MCAGATEPNRRGLDLADASMPGRGLLATGQVPVGANSAADDVSLARRTILSWPSSALASLHHAAAISTNSLNYARRKLTSWIRARVP
jgi:hypothetical protein